MYSGSARRSRRPVPLQHNLNRFRVIEFAALASFENCYRTRLAILSRASASGAQVAGILKPSAVTLPKWFEFLVTALLAICGSRKNVKEIACDAERIA